MAQFEMSAPGGAASSAPDIAKNLFWDDVRIGMGFLGYGVAVLLLAAVAGPWVLPLWLTALLVLVGGVLTVLAVKICAAIPPESGVNLPAQGAFFTGALCLVAAIVSFFMSWPPFSLLVVLLLGCLAHLLFAVVLLGCVRYLGHRELGPLALIYLLVAAVYSAVVIIFFLTPLSGAPAVVAILQVATLLVGGFLLFLSSGAAAALQRAQHGLPVEGSRTTTEIAAGPPGQPAKAPRSDVPEPLPEEFQFSKADVDGFQAQDSTAGKAIVVLMAGVFCVGVILYTIIAVMATM